MTPKTPKPPKRKPLTPLPSTLTVHVTAAVLGERLARIAALAPEQPTKKAA